MKLLSTPKPFSPVGGLRVAIALAIALVPIAVVVLLKLATGELIGYLTRDPNQTLGGHFYTGLLSNLGIFVWAAAATVSLFTAYGLRHHLPPHTRRFLWASGLLSLWLGFDDVFLFHDVLLPDYLSLPQPLIYAGYGGVVLAYLIGFRRVIGRTEIDLLGLSLGAFALSIGMDVVGRTDSIAVLLEDGGKFVGLVAWLGYHGRTAATITQQLLQAQGLDAQAAAPGPSLRPVALVSRDRR